MFILRLFCFFLLFALNVQARAGELIIERAWVQDVSNTMTLAQAKQANQISFDSKLFSQGFSQSAYWIRLRIDPSARSDLKPDEKLVVRIRPPYQDQVWFYDSLEKEDSIRVTGDYFDWEKDEYQSLNLNFILPLGEEPRDVWLKLKTNQSTLTLIEVMTLDEAHKLDRRQDLFMALYLAVLFICLGWAILARINHRDGLVSLYILREVMAILYGLAMFGHLRIMSSGWLPTAWLDFLTNLIVFVFVAAVIFFDSRLIGEFKPNRWLARAFLSLAMFCPVAIMMSLTGNIYEAIQINGLIVFVGIFLALACAISTRAWNETKNAPEDQRPVYPKAFLVGTYFLILMAVMLNRLPAMGIIDAQETFFYFNMIYPLVTSVALVVLVQARVYRMSRRQRESQYRLELAERNAEDERQRRIEQSNFLKMLAHEMKTPLSVVRMMTGAKEVSPQISNRVERAVSDMNNIIERLLQIEQLNDEKFVLKLNRFNLYESVKGIIVRSGHPDRWIIDCEVKPVVVLDQRFLEIILNNLVENAVKYGAADKPLSLIVDANDNQVQILVENHVGQAGVPDPDKVFEKYYRASGAYTFTGSGLGLFITKKLTELMSGRITVNVLGDQIRFKVVLPIHPSGTLVQPILDAVS